MGRSVDGQLKYGIDNCGGEIEVLTVGDWCGRCWMLMCVGSVDLVIVGVTLECWQAAGWFSGCQVLICGGSIELVSVGWNCSVDVWVAGLMNYDVMINI